jgi:hypothetical protein
VRVRVLACIVAGALSLLERDARTAPATAPNLLPARSNARGNAPQGEERADAEDKAEEGEGDDEGDEGGVAVDNGDAALLLLRALSAQDEEVAGKLKGGLIAERSCTVM